MDDGAAGVMGASRPKRRFWLAILVALVGVGGMASLLTRKGKAEVAADETASLQTESGAPAGTVGTSELRYVDVATAQLADPVAPLPATGRVAVDESRATPVMSPVAGRIDQVAVQLGSVVKKGDRLIAIRSTSLPQLGGEIDSTRSDLSVKQVSASRLRDLVKLHAVPEKDLLVAEAEVKEAEIKLRTADGKRRSLGLGALDHDGLFWLTAPRAGTIVDRNALVGMEIGPDRVEALLSIAELDEVLVIADLPEADAGEVKNGQMASVAQGNAAPLEGKVENVAAFVDPLRRTVAVRVRVPNSVGHLRPNAFAQVTFRDVDRAQRIVVPSEAVVTDGQKNLVFVREAGAAGHYRFVRRSVWIGRTKDQRTEVMEGLKPGETIVSRGALLLLNALDLEG